jgi:hypothetical protein
MIREVQPGAHARPIFRDQVRYGITETVSPQARRRISAVIPHPQDHTDQAASLARATFRDHAHILDRGTLNDAASQSAEAG